MEGVGEVDKAAYGSNGCADKPENPEDEESTELMGKGPTDARVDAALQSM